MVNTTMDVLRGRLPSGVFNNVYDFVTVSKEQVHENKKIVLTQLRRKMASRRLKKLFLRLRQRYAMTRLAMYFSSLAEEIGDLGDN